jgi:hypothetical protein
VLTAHDVLPRWWMQVLNLRIRLTRDAPSYADATTESLRPVG